MKTLERCQWRRSSVYIVNCEHFCNCSKIDQNSRFVLIVDFEQANFARLILKRETLLKTRSSISCVMLWDFNSKQNLLKNSMWTYTNATLLENQWEIFAKKFTSDDDSSHKDQAHIQNDLLYICLFTNFAPWKTN